MSKQNAITSFVAIKNGKLYRNGLLVLDQLEAPGAFFDAATAAMNLGYLKFFKMDNLCKTAFVAVEALLQGRNLAADYKPEEMGVVFSNANSSLDTDVKYYQASLQAPGPALFVYTLPNIAIGEICIRHGIKGETACFVFDIFDSSFQTWYVNTLLDTCGVKACISGWADFYNNRFEAFFYLVEQQGANPVAEHNAENIDKIFNTAWKN